jgi:hypothetical protein
MKRPASFFVNPFQSANGLCGRLFGLAMTVVLIGVFACDAQAQRRNRNIPSSKPKAGNNSNATDAQNQPPTQAQPTKKAKKKAPPKPGEKVSPDPENVVLEVKGEGILLTATYFAPPTIPVPAAKVPGEEIDEEPGKSVSPFILLHDWDGERSQMLPLANFLQSAGHAVLVPDLRGHGESLSMRGSNAPLDYRNFKKNEVATTVGDIEQCKRFLREKNDLGEMNIDLLNVVAVGDTSHIAVEWAVSDWSWPPIGLKKQGQDVKSLVLFSPTKKFGSYSMMKMAKAPIISGKNGSALPMMVVWGAGSNANSDCTDICEALAKNRPPSESRDPAVVWFEQDFFKVTPNTQLSGAQIVQSKDAKPIWTYIVDFTAQKVLAHKDKCPWQVRGK